LEDSLSSADHGFDGPQGLAPGARWLFYLNAWLALLPTAALLAGGAAVASIWLPWTVAGIGAGVLFFLQFLAALWIPWLSFERWRWELRSDALIVSHGVLFRERTAIPLGRVQHVDVRQGPLETWFGLARIQVHTASGALGADGMIPGLRLTVAEQLRDALVARVQAEEDDGV
jgi:uncharacterized protein